MDRYRPHRQWPAMEQPALVPWGIGRCSLMKLHHRSLAALPILKRMILRPEGLDESKLDGESCRRAHKIVVHDWVGITQEGSPS